jgi:hypothetical protein
VVPLPVVPVLVDPVLADPVLAVPLSVPPEAVAVGLVVAPPEPGVLDAGGGGVEDALPGADEDSVALGLAVLDGVAVDVAQGVPVALGDALRAALLLAVAEAVEVAVPFAVPFTVPVVVAVLVAVVVPLGLVPPPTVLPPDPLSVALLGVRLDALLTGVPLGVTDFAGLAAADEDVEHAVGSALLWPAEVPPWPVPLAAEPIGVLDPFVLGTPLPVLELGITAEASWTKASRSGGTARATPMANTAQAAARAGRSSPYRQSRCCRGA